MISRCSIIGFGSMGKKHAKNARECGLSVKYWDPDVDMPRSEFECVRSELDALEWCDIAVIASPPQFHTSNLESAIFAGRPCLVEKPVSNSEAGLERIASIAEERNIVVSVGQNLRYHPAVNYGKSCIADGRLGNISSQFLLEDLIYQIGDRTKILMTIMQQILTQVGSYLTGT